MAIVSSLTRAPSFSPLAGFSANKELFEELTHYNYDSLIPYGTKWLTARPMPSQLAVRLARRFIILKQSVSVVPFSQGTSIKALLPSAV